MLLAITLTIKSAEVSVVVRFFRTRLDAPSYRFSRLLLGNARAPDTRTPLVSSSQRKWY